MKHLQHRRISDSTFEIGVDGMSYYVQYVDGTWWLYVPGDSNPVEGYRSKRDALNAIRNTYHTPRAVAAHRRAVERTRRQIAREIAAARKGA